VGIPESAIIRDMSTSRSLIEMLRNSGTEVMLCRFGSVSASLMALGNLSVSGIGIDRHLTGTILSGHSSIAVVSGVLSMASSLKMDLLLGGIESFEEGILFLAVGGTYVQGFAAGLPMDPDHILNWIESFALPEDWHFWVELSWPQGEIDLLRGALEEKRRFRQWLENPEENMEVLHETDETPSFWKAFTSGEGRKRFDGRPEFLEILRISAHLHDSLDACRSMMRDKRAPFGIKDFLAVHRDMIRLLGKLVS
jgi:hypothetical protein